MRGKAAAMQALGQPLAVLTEEEHRRVREQKRLLDDAEMTVSMLRCSYRVLWRTLTEKYELPAEFELDEAGQVFERAEEAS